MNIPGNMGKFNVASAAMVRGRIDQLWERFEAAGFPDHQLPDDRGWTMRAPFSGQLVGRVEIRDTLSTVIEARVGHRVPYTRAQQSNLMREGHVLDACSWPVMSIPMIPYPLLETLADQLVSQKSRRLRHK